MQSRTAALIEKFSETSAGFAINFTALNWILNPFYDLQNNMAESLGMTVFFTVMSFGRGYIFRRLFTIYHEAIERFAAFIRRYIMSDKSSAPAPLPLKLTALDFKEASLVPTEAGHYVIINEEQTYVKCVARFTDDGQFIAFCPEFLPTTPIIKTRVLAWARLPHPRDIIRHLFNQFSANSLH